MCDNCLTEGTLNHAHNAFQYVLGEVEYFGVFLKAFIRVCEGKYTRWYGRYAFADLAYE